MQDKNNIEWLTPEDFERIYSIIKETQAKMRLAFIRKNGKLIPNSNRLPYSKVGKFVRYDRQKIDNFFAAREVTL